MIQVFRTSVETEEQVVIIGAELSGRLPRTAQWNFDLQDCDHILRVVNGGDFAAEHCAEILRANGFTCEELFD